MRRWWVLAVALATLAGCGSGVAEPSGSDTTAAPDGSSVDVVAPDSVEAFCALSAQLEQLVDERYAAVSLDDPEAFRAATASFLTDHDAVIESYVEAAPPEIEADVRASMDQTRAAASDPAVVADILAGRADTSASDRVSAFIGANCPGAAGSGTTVPPGTDTTTTTAPPASEASADTTAPPASTPPPEATATPAASPDPEPTPAADPTTDPSVPPPAA